VGKRRNRQKKSVRTNDFQRPNKKEGGGLYNDKKKKDEPVKEKTSSQKKKTTRGDPKEGGFKKRGVPIRGGKRSSTGRGHWTVPGKEKTYGKKKKHQLTRNWHQRTRFTALKGGGEGYERQQRLKIKKNCEKGPRHFNVGKENVGTTRGGTEREKKKGRKPLE